VNWFSKEEEIYSKESHMREIEVENEIGERKLKIENEKLEKILKEKFTFSI
jgi:hypothetical protein